MTLADKNAKANEIWQELFQYSDLVLENPDHFAGDALNNMVWTSELILKLNALMKEGIFPTIAGTPGTHEGA